MQTTFEYNPKAGGIYRKNVQGKYEYFLCVVDGHFSQDEYGFVSLKDFNRCAQSEYTRRGLFLLESCGVEVSQNDFLCDDKYQLEWKNRYLEARVKYLEGKLKEVV